MIDAFPAGNYSFLPSVFQYSGGACASSGFEVERVRFHSSVPLAEGFARIERIITDAGRPLTAFCACELRSPAPYTEDGFRAFNEHYVKTLTKWGLFDGKTNPVARSNVCPQIDPPPEPSFHAFSFTRPSTNAMRTFVISGGAEAREGEGSYRERIVRFGDVSPDGLREKALQTVGEMERRLAAFGLAWKDSTATQVYTVHDFHPFFADEIVRRGAVRSGLTWHFNRPPVVGIEFEMDVRGVAREFVV
jgi:hypothetical protein